VSVSSRFIRTACSHVRCAKAEPFRLSARQAEVTTSVYVYEGVRMANAFSERIRTISTAITVLALSACINAQTTAPSAGCSLSTLSSPSPVFPTLTSPAPMQTPIAELSITEDGAVSKVRLPRSSNQQSWDRAILKTLKTWRFSHAPGCGLRKTKVSIDIHAR
jgi:TonB family protein